MEQYEIIESISVKDYLRLRYDAGWAALTPEQAQNGLDNSFKILAVRYNDEVVGMARLLWDGGYCAYLTDVIVSFEHRHRGIATDLINRLLAALEAELKPGWQVKVHLLSAKGKEGFYKRFGFIERPDATYGAGMEKWLRA